MFRTSDTRGVKGCVPDTWDTPEYFLKQCHTACARDHDGALYAVALDLPYYSLVSQNYSICQLYQLFFALARVCICSQNLSGRLEIFLSMVPAFRRIKKISEASSPLGERVSL